ncbi:MAG: MFS transporter [Candidatus Pacebacteria bacterium]|nr:MFS transporter [Candidatus Paceibacterota bacterium]
MMNHFYNILRYTFDQKLSPIGMMVFFFILFDGVLMYLAPIIITGAGISESMMGIIIGSSSIVGMVFDYLLYRMVKTIHYRRIFLVMFALALLFPVFLLGGSTIFIFLLAMAVWGIYYDFYNIGMLDIVERTSEPEEHASKFGILRSFEGLGYLLAPFFASVLLVYLNPGPVMFFVILIPFLISFILYLNMAIYPIPERSKYVRFKESISLFFQRLIFKKEISLPIFPLLITFFINLVDTAIWTFGPLFSEQMGSDNNILGGSFMIAFALPPILIGWFIGSLVNRFGNTNAAQASIAFSSIFLILVGLTTSPSLLIILIFIASFFLAIGIPSVNAIYTGYINKVAEQRKQTETIQDFFTNIGTTTGPVIGGYAAEYFGLSHAFIALGVIGLAVVFMLFIFTSRINHNQ